MKKKLFIMLVIIACLGLGACSKRNVNSIDSQGATSKPDTSASDSVIVENEKDYNQEEQTIFCSQILTWKKEDGSIMELTVSVPKTWKCDFPNKLSTKQFSGEIMFINEEGEKIAGSLGVLLKLKKVNL